MAFQTISVDNLTPTFFEMINQGALDAPVFAFYLETSGENGELSLGQMDPAHYTGPVQVVPLSSETYFEVQLDDLSINGQKVTTVNKAILDTGTSLLAGPTADVKALMTQLGATPFPLNPNEYTIDCAAVPKLPTLEIAIGGSGAKFALNGTQYTLSVEGMCLMAFTVRGLNSAALARRGTAAFAGLCDVCLLVCTGLPRPVSPSLLSPLRPRRASTCPPPWAPSGSWATPS